MALKDLVLANRSCRGYDPSCSLSADNLLELVEHARFAASSMNAQALKFRLVHKEQERADILAMSRWAAKLKDRKLPEAGKEPGAFIVICHDASIAPMADYFFIDTGIAAQTILLAAVERGLAGCVNIAFNKEKLSNALSLPENLTPILLMAIGKPNEKIVLTDVKEDGNTSYYRDQDDVHYVPKRALKDIAIL